MILSSRTDDAVQGVDIIVDYRTDPVELMIVTDGTTIIRPCNDANITLKELVQILNDLGHGVNYVEIP